jgi:uncharacterized protein YbaP (TraB family)
MRCIRSLCLPVLAGLLLLAGASVQAQSAAGCPPPGPSTGGMGADEVRARIRDRGLLWRLEKDGRSSWLYGTVHVNRFEWTLPGPRTMAALAGSDVVALELDPTDPELPRLFTARGDAAREARVLADLRPRLARLSASACLPADRLAALRPLFQLMALSLAEAGRDGFHPELGVDSVLFGMARRLGKPFVALETVAGQLAALVPETEADERALMQKGLQDLESGAGREQLRRLLQAWADGDEALLASYPQWCKCLDTPAEQRFFWRLNDDRNGALADRIAAMHAGGKRVFAGVGALHMTGPNALPALLAARGFQVERIPFPSSR